MFRGNLRKFEVHGGPTPLRKGTLFTFGPWDFSGLERRTLFTYNQGADALDRGVVLVSPDNVLWGTISATTFNTLGSDVLAWDQFDDTIRWWKIQVASTGGTGTFSYWWNF